MQNVIITCTNLCSNLISIWIYTFQIYENLDYCNHSPLSSVFRQKRGIGWSVAYNPAKQLREYIISGLFRSKKTNAYLHGKG